MKICGWKRLGGRELICDAEAAKRWENLNDFFLCSAHCHCPLAFISNISNFFRLWRWWFFSFFLLSIRFWPFAGPILNRENFAICCARLDLTRRNLILQYETFFLLTSIVFCQKSFVCLQFFLTILHCCFMTWYTYEYFRLFAELS